MSGCEHYNLTGDEGPIADLGRWPTRWRCDTCDAVIHEVPCACDQCPELPRSEEGTDA